MSNPPATRELQVPTPKFRRIEERASLLQPKRFMNLLGLAVFLLAFFLPFIDASRYIMSIGTSAVIYVMLAAGLNVVVGYAGLLDLGYIAFFAVGAYTSGILTTTVMPGIGRPLGIIEAIPVVILFCVLAGIIIGGPTLRLRSDYLAIVTLGFGEIIRITANNLTVTGGPSGIHGIPKFSFFGWDMADGLAIGGLEFNGQITFYMFCVVVAALAVVGAARLAKGRMGRAWKAVRDDEDAAEAMGINTYLTKLTAYITGAIWGGMAGVLMGANLSAVAPGSFLFLNSALILMAVVLGGMGSTPGIIIGALFISLAPEALRAWSEWRYLIFGVLLIVTMIFRPQGLWPANAVLPFLKRTVVTKEPLAGGPPVAEGERGAPPEKGHGLRPYKRRKKSAPPPVESDVVEFVESGGQLPDAEQGTGADMGSGTPAGSADDGGPGDGPSIGSTDDGSPGNGAAGDGPSEGEARS